MNETFVEPIRNDTLSLVCPISTFYWIIQTVICPISYILYIMVLYTIFRYREFTNTYYTLVLALGVADMITNIYVVHAFICCLFGYNYLGIFADRIITFLFASTGWYFGIYLNLFISLNRFVAIVFFVRYKQLWTNFRTKIFIFICLVMGLLTASPYTLLTTIYSVPGKTTSFQGSEKLAEIMTTFDFISSTGPAVIFLILYTTSVVFSVVRMRNFVGVKSKYVREIKMMIQGILIGAMIIIVDILSHTPAIGEMSWVLPTVLMTGLNPIIYIALDSRIRDRLFKSDAARKISTAIETAVSHAFEMNIKPVVNQISSHSENPK